MEVDGVGIDPVVSNLPDLRSVAERADRCGQIVGRYRLGIWLGVAKRNRGLVDVRSVRELDAERRIHPPVHHLEQLLDRLWLHAYGDRSAQSGRVRGIEGREGHLGVLDADVVVRQGLAVDTAVSGLGNDDLVL